MYFRYYLALEKGLNSIILNLFTQRYFVSRFFEIGPMVLEKKIFKSLNFVNVYLQFRNYLSLEMVVVFHLNKCKSPSPKDALSQFDWY